MKASPEHQLLLLDVQRLDNAATRIAHQMTSLQKGAELAELATRAAALRSELASATADVEDAERELARLEADTATAEARIHRDTTLLTASGSVKDRAGLESELTSLNRRIGDLETTELEVMERIETLQARVGDLQTQFAALEIERRTAAEQRDVKLAALAEERAAAERDRASVVAAVPADLLALYERQRARYGFGASLLQGGVSTASGVGLTGSDLAAVRAAAPDDVILCPDSDAILVRAADSGL